jgi:protein tyrosine phosphatase
MESENTLMDNLIVRKLKIYKDQKEVREVTQIQLINWPDHMAPLSPYLLYPLIDYVDSGKNFGPVVVHCSAGNGRTGCFIAVYNIVQCLKLLKEINQELQQTVKPFFSVFNICRKLREQRQGIISSSEQYKFVYEFAAGYSQKLFFS